ncbi:MAG TPA: N-acetylmuramoyl-L-alanine amidase [Drouetiella sp.]|jgi:N-acetylmuramoyl-L-alanine amidase
MKRTAFNVALTALSGLFVVSCNSSEAGKEAVEPPRQVSQAIERPAPDESIRVTYPSGSAIPASSTFIAGAIAAGTSLTCNGAAVHVSPEGFFVHVVPLKPGDNTFLLVQQQTGKQRELTIKREMPQPPISEDTFKIDEEHLQPANDRGVVVGDLIEFSAKATPQAEVIVALGKRKIILRPATAVSRAASANRHHKKSVKATVANSSVNQGLDAAYGKVYQRRAASPPDLYVGYYKVQADDQWNGIAAKYTLNHAGKTKSISGKAKFTTIAQPMLAETIHTDTIVRVGPGAGRTTPLSNGVRFFVDGWQGDQIRCNFAPNHHFWIKRDDLIFEPSSNDSGPAPNSVARTINIGADDYGATVTVPLSQRLPYQIEQQLKPSELILRIFGVTADTDWITPASTPVGLLDRVSCKQSADGIYEVRVPLKSSRQWGFKADYDDTNLVLHIKAPPKLKDPNSLQGLTICVDPGHGGRETGAIGCSGIKEATINLGIAMRLKTLLENSGAKVIMTRVADRDVSLDERVDIANKARADILLSVHNNSLPDGRDPLTEHGTSSYWYHPQSIALARTINSGMVQDLGFPDFGSRFQNLALTRPSGMLATLAEVGFVINPEEYAMLISPSGQQRAADGILKGLFTYLHPPVKH